MEKVCRYDAAAADAYHAQQGEPILSIDQLHDTVYEQRPTPVADSKVRFRSKCV